MRIFKNILIFIWRIWFYGWVLFTIIPIFPFLLIIMSKEKWYPIFFKIASTWAKTILFVMGFKIKLEGQKKIDSKKSYLFCPNHTSMIDIMLMFAITKNPFVFVGKKELTKIPVFGYVFKKTNIIVDRTDSKSGRKAFADADRRLKNGTSICIFPEGKVPSDENIILDVFKSGAFRLAIEHKIPIVPITFYDSKKRFSYTFFSGSPGKLRVKIHDFITTDELTLDDRIELKQKTFDVIYKSLIK
ncbi:MAG: 1-acyl-sn-glycerol-3-phosphate acyltransferase [Flavobacteriaceae bacterium]|nr:1-acyl-sn-glycerol-3-phosphate acyltransferase [Flavobacteriaceae bacterium]